VENANVGRHLIDQPMISLLLNLSSTCAQREGGCRFGAGDDTQQSHLVGWVNGTGVEVPMGADGKAPPGELHCELSIAINTDPSTFEIVTKLYLGMARTPGDLVFPSPADPNQIPQARLDYLGWHEDGAHFVGCIRKLYAALSAPAFTSRFGNVSSHFEPSAALLADDSAALTWARAHVDSGGHVTGTARMARSSADGVVDPTQHVFGVDGLTVADLSAAPTTNGAHTQAQALLLGQKLAEGLLGRAAAQATAAQR
jgi:hypothetical protein